MVEERVIAVSVTQGLQKVWVRVRPRNATYWLMICLYITTL
jgi:hypothetical protein